LALSLRIDHAVIAVRDLDAAAADFRALGFTLTPRGQHSIGSQNHCITLATSYFELLAAPVEHPWLDYYRGFLREHGDGLAAVALSTDDADATYADLHARGVAAKAPMDLSRPVEGGVARFRLVQIEAKPGVFICQHLTPELVWRREWQSHANGATELTGVALRAERPFDALPAAIKWGAAQPALRIRGLRREHEAHGVRLIAG
jgi:catechol 2,3-dioxygenase-like lactoylglutathione lyase family enzyme